MAIPTKAKKQAQEAYNILQQTGQSTVSIKNKDLIKLGSTIWPITYKDGRTDEEAFEELMDNVDRRSERGDTEGYLTKVSLRIPNEQMMVMWSGRWVDQGCPRILFDSKYATLLMSTDVGKDLTDKIVFPYKAFLIELPDNLLDTKDGEGKMQPLRKVFVQVLVHANGDDVVNIIALTDIGLQLWRHGLPISELTNTMLSEDTSWDYGLDCESRDDRVMNLIGRLIISMCVAMSDPDNYRKQKRSKRRYGGGYKSRSNSGLPEIQTFVVGEPTKLNCRPAVLNYLKGKKGTTRKGPTVQFLVRGHWRYQPYGPKRKKRKFIRIDPYWKGPEDAKILARTVQMDSK
jgi:hypothetical protein